MRKGLFLCLVMVLLLAILNWTPLTIVEVEATHQSRVTCRWRQLSKEPQLWKYTYKVYNNSTKADRGKITDITISKTKTAKVAMRKKTGWKVEDLGGWFSIYAPIVPGRLVPQYSIGRGESGVFYICSRQDPSDQFAVTAEERKEGKVRDWFGLHPVKAPDTKPPEEGKVDWPRFYKEAPRVYHYTLTWISGYADYFWLILQPGVIVENVAISNPEWDWYHYAEEGLLLFNTTTSPLTETNPQVSMSFSSPNSVEGEVGTLAPGFGGQIVGPVLPAVGDVWVPVDKLALLAPYIGLASTILVATAVTAIYVKRVKRRKEKQ